RNPLGTAMCKELEAKIYQQSLIIIRFHSELVNMVEEYNRMSEESDSTQSTLNQPYSSLTDWEEVIEMAKRPVEDVISCSQPMGRSSSHNGGSSSRSDSFFKTIYQSPLSDATATGSTDQAIGVKGASTGNLPAAPPPTAASSSDGRIESKTFNTPLRRIPQKTFPWQMTPPIEEVAELRQRLKELEQSPLFTSSHIAKRTQKNDMSLPSTKVHSHSNINSINSISDIGKQQSQCALPVVHHSCHFSSQQDKQQQQQQQQKQPKLKYTSPLRYQQLQAPCRPLYSFP
ncbi:hypothetical protein IW140_002485, partial [Coemansia sp. RSA 1813]